MSTDQTPGVQMTSERFDHQTVADFVTNEWPDHARSLQEFSRLTGVSVSTLRRLMKDGDPSLKPSTLRAIERGLSVPPRTLDLVRVRDLEALHSSGLADAPMLWISQRFSKDAATSRNQHTG